WLHQSWLPCTKAAALLNHPGISAGLTEHHMITSFRLFSGRYGAVVLAALVSMTTPALSVADAQTERGQAAAAVCVACHQADGNGLQTPASAWPRLAGLDAQYIAAQLHAFKSGERQSAEMKPFADMLNDD